MPRPKPLGSGRFFIAEDGTLEPRPRLASAAPLRGQSDEDYQRILQGERDEAEARGWRKYDANCPDCREVVSIATVGTIVQL